MEQIKYNKWTYIGQAGCNKHGRTLIKCQCDCGIVKIAMKHYFQKQSKQCINCKYVEKNCFKPGDRFGQWTVITPIEGPFKENGYRYACKCDCGNEATIPPAVTNCVFDLI